MNNKEILEIINKLEMFRFSNVYTDKQIEKDKKTLNNLKKQLTIPVVSGSFSAKDMENFAAKCLILGNNGKTTKELLKDFCKYDR